MKEALQARLPGVGLRGANLLKSSARFADFFDQKSWSLPPADFKSDEDKFQVVLKKLTYALLMALEPPEEEPDEEECGIFAEDTYYGQLYDHDVTFDPKSSSQKQNDPAALEDHKKPSLWTYVLSSKTIESEISIKTFNE